MSRDNDSHYEALIERAQEDMYKVVGAPRRSYAEKMRELIREKEAVSEECVVQTNKTA